MPTYANPSLMTTVLYGVSGSAGHDLHYGGGTGWAYATNTHRFFTTANQTTGNGTERLRITSDGAIQCKGETDVQNSIFRVTDATPRIIMSVPSGGLDTRLFNDGSGNFIIGHGTNSDTPTERLRITSEGQVKLTGSNSGNHMATFGPNVGGLTIDDVGQNHTALQVSHGSNNVFLVASSNNSAYLSSYGTGSLIFELTGGGGTRERARIDSSGNFMIGSTSAEVS